ERGVGAGDASQHSWRKACRIILRSDEQTQIIWLTEPGRVVAVQVRIVQTASIVAGRRLERLTPHVGHDANDPQLGRRTEPHDSTDSTLPGEVKARERFV